MGATVRAKQNIKRPPGLDQLLALVDEDMTRVNAEILARAVSQVDMIPEVANHLINSGGKRLRPILTLASARMCGYQGSDHIKLAASVEFMHTATLLHDDVVDQSDLRRGKAAARMLWGNEASVLVGDYLLGQAFKMMVETGSIEALAILSNAAAVIAEGEVMQISTARNIATTEQTYLEVIHAKTATLFAAAGEVGAVVADKGELERQALRDYGRDLGIAFQLIDDALDYSGEQRVLGKTVGDDFREGKMTLPVVLCVMAADGEESKFWTRTVQKLDQNDGDLDRALELMTKHKALEGTVDKARRFGEKAKLALKPFGDSPYAVALGQTVDFCISRVY